VLILSHPFPPAITPTENINHKNHVSLFPNFLMHWKCDQIKACQMIVFLIFRKNLFGFLLMIFFHASGEVTEFVGSKLHFFAFCIFNL
jgi:hypothetical protein